jgi:hypothetical protein
MFAAMTRRIRGVCSCDEWKMERDVEAGYLDHNTVFQHGVTKEQI